MPKLRFSNGQGQTIDVDSPDGSTPSEAELDEMFSKAYPQQGLLGRAWGGIKSGLDQITTPIAEHAGKAIGMDPALALQVAKTVGGATSPFARNTGIASMAASTSPLDVITGPAMAATAPLRGASPLVQGAVKGSRLLEIGAGLGMGTQGISELVGAAQKGDWSQVPSGVIKSVIGAAMAKPNATRAVDNALNELDEINKGSKVWDPEVTETLTAGVEEEALARLVDDAQSALINSDARRVNSTILGKALKIGSKNVEPILPILVQRGVLTPEGATGSFRINPEAITRLPGSTAISPGPRTLSLEERLQGIQDEVLGPQTKQTLDKTQRHPLKPRGHDPERPFVEGRFREKGLRAKDRSAKEAFDELMQKGKKGADDGGDDPFELDSPELSIWTKHKAEFPMADNAQLTKAVESPVARVTTGGKTHIAVDPHQVADPVAASEVLRSPYIKTLLGKYEQLVRIAQGHSPGMQPTAIDGVLIDPVIRGLTDVNPNGSRIWASFHAMALEARDRVQRGILPAEKASMWFAARVKANALHEYAHAKNLLPAGGHGEVFKFLQQENRRSASITRGSFYNKDEWNGLYESAIADADKLFGGKRGIPRPSGPVLDAGVGGVGLARDADEVGNKLIPKPGETTVSPAGGKRSYGEYETSGMGDPQSHAEMVKQKFSALTDEEFARFRDLDQNVHKLNLAEHIELRNIQEKMLPEAERAGFREITELLAKRQGERGAVALDLPQTLGKAAYQKGKGALKEGGDLMRASLAGDLAVAVRNVESGGRMILKGVVGSKGASTIARLRAARESIKGNDKVASALRASAQRHDEVAKAYGKATIKSAVSTFSDALSFMSKGRIKPEWGDPSKFGEQLDVMSELGQKKLSDKLKAFSSAEVTTETGSKAAQMVKKGMMFFNIMGDRFINKTFLTAHMDALQNIYGLSSPKAVLRLAEQNPGLKTEIEDFLEKAGAEAFRASWQNISPSGTIAKKVTRLLDNTPGGILIQPFAKAFLSNMLPNVMESWPVLAMGSKRVRNSFDHEALRTAWKALREEGSERSLKRASHLKTKMRKLEMDGVYDTNMIYSRMLMGPLVVAAAAARRVASGDDGTNFDEAATQMGPDGKATQVAGFTSQVGEDLPAWLIGDILGHEILSKKTGRPSKYEGPAGQVYIGELMKGLYGSRYGYNSPLMTVVGDLISGKKKISEELLGNTAEAVMEDLGRMAGQGAWVGGIWRTVAQAGSDDERIIRRADVSEKPTLMGRMGESFKEGVQAQIPSNPIIPNRKELPPSISWPKLDASRKAAPVESLLGGGAKGLDEKPISKLVSMIPGMTRREISELERFAEDQPKNVSLSEILPRRSQDPEFDQMLLARFKEGVEKKILPVLRAGKVQTLTPQEKAAWWHRLSDVRETAQKRAELDYRKKKGHRTQRELDEKAKEKEKKTILRSARKKLRQP